MRIARPRDVANWSRLGWLADLQAGDADLCAVEPERFAGPLALRPKYP